MSKYVAPHLRDNTMPRSEQRRTRPSNQKTYWDRQREIEQKTKDEEEKLVEKKRIESLEMTEENFPALGNSSTKTTGWGGRKFSELASEWKEEDDKLIETETMNSVREDTREDFVLPRFMTTRRFEEPEDVAEEPKPASPVDDEWTVVSHRKVRKPKPIIDDEFDQRDEVNENGDTVWDAPEEHETCWDERR
jgi:hypothetical protein